MTDYIVLVKQVPDITQITDNAFDPVTGTLVRSRLANVTNDLDAQALAFANQMRSISKDEDARIICLTMGPPMAEDILRYALARHCDQAVLLTDRALGGADTWATANPLAFAVKKIASEMLRSERDYYVVCGMQSVDGDTAQVPPQVAEQLSVPCIAYVTDVAYSDGRFEFTRIVSGGSQTVRAKRLPAVMTVAKHEYPLFATFAGARRANRAEIIKLSAEDIGATSVGAKGSKTSVIRVFPPGKSTRKCTQLTDVAALAQVLIDSFEKADSEEFGEVSGESRYILPAKRSDVLDRSFEGLAKERQDFDFLTTQLKTLGITDVTAIDAYTRQKLINESGGHFHKKSLEDMLTGLQLTEPSYAGQVWVVAEHTDGVVHPATFELIGKGRELADDLETKVGVVLVGHEVRKCTDELTWTGADIVYLIEHKLLADFDPLVHRKAISDCITAHAPQIVLFAATPRGRLLAPMVSYRCGAGLTADCTGLEIRDSSRRGLIGILLQTRPALGGNVMATICTKNSGTQMATARPGVMKGLPEDKSRASKIVEHAVELTEADLSLDIVRTEKGGGTVSLDVDAIVSGGKGMQNRDNYERLIGSLCSALSEKLQGRVEKGASRAAVEQGFAERICQVGQTGTSVGPRLYIAVGISGAIQHMIGVANTETIVAINSDPGAPIFKQCDYYMVGAAEDVVPNLVQALKDQA